MRILDALYDWPIAEINRLSDSQTAEDYAGQLTEPLLSEFTTLTEKMRGHGADLALSKAAREHFTQWIELRQSVEIYQVQFSNFPGQVFNKLLLFLILADKVAQTTAPLDANPIDENQFELRELQCTLPLRWFSYENSRSFQDSMVVFCCDDFQKLGQEIQTQNISPKLLFHLLATLIALPDVPLMHSVLIKKTNPAIELAAVDAFTRLVILMSGRQVHTPKKYTVPISVLSCDVVTAGDCYQQWNEVLNVLSEYNYRDEILLKFLTIYHVFENLMLKFPIVELERQQAGRMFTMRDFKRLYQQIDEKEHAALKRLFTNVLQIDATPGVSFINHIVTRWQGLVPTTPQIDIEDALRILGLKKNHHPLSFTEFTNGADCAGYFTQMVYQTRCAIVHNKETELHLTYATLNNGFTTLIEKFLIPSLEELCFALISTQNQHVWYSQKELLLYQ